MKSFNKKRLKKQFPPFLYYINCIWINATNHMENNDALPQNQFLTL